MASKPSKKAKDKLSAWLITINTNQRFGSVEEAKEFMIGLQTATRNVLQRPKDIVVFTEAAKARGEHWSPDVILNAMAKQGVEWSEDNHLVHVHAVIQFRHRSTIRLNYAAIKSKIQNHLVEHFPQWMCYSNGEPKKLYFNARAFTPSQAVVDYVTKDKDFLQEHGVGEGPLTTAESPIATLD